MCIHMFSAVPFIPSYSRGTAVLQLNEKMNFPVNKTFQTKDNFEIPRSTAIRIVTTSRYEACIQKPMRRLEFC